MEYLIFIILTAVVFIIIKSIMLEKEYLSLYDDYDSLKKVLDEEIELNFLSEKTVNNLKLENKKLRERLCLTLNRDI